MRALSLAGVSLCFSAARAFAGDVSPPERETLAVEFRLPDTGRVADAIAWKDEGEIYADIETLHKLGLNIPGADGDVVALRDAPGVSYNFDAGEQAVILKCSAACYEANIVALHADAPDAPLQSGTGAFLNADLAASRIEKQNSFAGQFELGLFRPEGFGGTTWTMGARGQANVVRLETNWTKDFVGARARLRFGDSLTNSTATNAPVRFGGVQLATDFSLDPSYITFPTPSLKGQAAAPSSLDLYVNGVLRQQNEVEPGPFSFTDTPVVVGAGEARVVVTDALGREQSITVPFYASPRLLKPRLSEYSLAVGAEREDFAYRSNEYRRGFFAGAYRRGFGDWFTGGGHLQLASTFSNIGGEISFTHPGLGQFELAAAGSEGDDGQGGLVKAGWSRLSERISIALEGQAADKEFRRIGDNAPPPRTLARGTIGVDAAHYGAAALSATTQRTYDKRRIDTLGLSYTAPLKGQISLGLSALLVDDGKQRSSIGLTLVRALGGQTTALTSLDSIGGDLTATARVQSLPARGQGLGWRGAVAAGARGRLDAGLIDRDEKYEAQADFSHAHSGSGVRAQFATGFVWVGGEPMVSGPVRESFALVDVGAPNVGVLRDRRPAGRTDKNGRILLTELRPYQNNTIGVNLDDVPESAEIDADEMRVKPRGRSGVIVKFPMTMGAGGEIAVLDAAGQRLPAGATFIREKDSARFPVGQDGRIYLSGVASRTVLRLDGATPCTLVVQPDDFQSETGVQCSTGGGR